jgi:PKD repeat protein
MQWSGQERFFMTKAKTGRAFAHVFFASLFFICSAEGSTFLTFDDLSAGSDYAPIPSGYGGLRWANFYVINGAQRPAGEGYHIGTISTPNVAFNLAGDPAGFDYGGVPFDLNSAYVTAAFANPLQIRAQGYSGNNVVYDNIYVVNATNASLVNFNYLNVTYVRFVAESIFALENLTVTHTNIQTNPPTAVQGSTFLTFDDLSPGSDYAMIPDGYGGLRWYNFYVINGAQRPAGEGYHIGTISTPNVAFNPAGDAAGFDYGGVPFDLNFAYVTAAFGNALQIRAQGYSGNNVVYDNIYEVNSTNASLVSFNYFNITYVRFVATPSSIFVLDNLTVTHTNGPTAAKFSVSSTSGQAPLAVQFLDQSTGAITNWDWNFGDGSPHSSIPNPSHTFSLDGVFSTSLTVSDSKGVSTNKAVTITVTPSARFMASPNSGQAPLNVQFTNASIGAITNWDWNFGDGSPHSSVENPSHNYNMPGTFTATLNVTGASGLTSTRSTNIIVTPLANFTANPSYGQMPLNVQFTDQSTGTITNWDWNFGDGSAHSSEKNPSHTYNDAGYYTAVLTVAASNGMNASNMATITVAPPPICSSPAAPPVNSGMVRGWGCNYFGQINTACISNVLAIAAGRDHSLFLKSDGTIVALGKYSEIPVVIPPGLSNVIAITSGDYHSLALKSDGTVVGWGQTSVPPGLSNVVAISAGANHSLALNADGTIVGWGTTTVPSGLSNIVAVSAGRGISMALRDDGTAVGWNLGRGADPSTLSNLVAISAGDNCCYEAGEALQSDGTLLVGSAFTNKWFVNRGGVVAISCSRGSDSHVSWGLDASGGVFAIGGFAFCGGPFIPPEGIYNAVAVASGDAHNLALIGDGPPVTHASLLNPSWDLAGFHTSVATENGRVYRLEYKSWLGENSWHSLPLVAGNGSLVSLVDPTAAGDQRFYRVRRW